MAVPNVVWLKTCAIKFMDMNELTTITPEVIAHIIDVAGDENKLDAAEAIKELILEYST